MPAPLFSGLKTRAAGVLLHPTALPSGQGIGCFGGGARAFVDFLAEAGVTWWQTCPLGPTGAGDSPYSCLSAFAGNARLIDLDDVRDAGLVSENDLAPLRSLSPARVDYGALAGHFERVADIAWENAKARPETLRRFGDFEAFKRAKAGWLDDYALFIAIKETQSGKAWYDWPDDEKHIASARVKKRSAAFLDRAERQRFLQFVFFAHLDALRAHAAFRGVKLLGDAPIYVAHDSADVWASPALFELDATLTPTFVAGVPPDYFSETGQLWGNPLYDWKRHARDGYDWWIARLRANLDLADGLRLDHFRAFHDYWRVPAGATDARAGKWADGPGLPFFKAVRDKLGDALIVAEDLGDLTPGVPLLRDACGLPGMAVLEFAFADDAANLYLPHNHRVQQVVYPGTHDNDTACGWYDKLDTRTRDRFRKYFGTDGAAANWTLIRACYTSPARLAIVAMQDLLGLGSEARFNVPGEPSGNWSWRLEPHRLDEARAWIAPNLRELAGLTGR